MQDFVHQQCMEFQEPFIKAGFRQLKVGFRNPKPKNPKP